MNNTNVHGGDLDIISRRYNISKEKLINFSGNVNPLGLPQSVKTAISENVGAVVDYPDVSYINLRKAIGEYTKVNFENILVGNGSTELISSLIKTLKPKNSIIVSPAYSEYLKEIKLAGGDYTLLPLKEEEDFSLDVTQIPVTDSTDLIVLCNPNNPTGSYADINQIEQLLTVCKKTGTWLMIDETYVEFSHPSAHVSAMALTEKFDNLFIIRGTSKFFACPGLRLGYGICSNADLRDKINAFKDPWSVGTLAVIGGCVMFTDKEFINKTVELINTQRDRLINELSKIKDLKLYPTQSNFILAKILRKDITSHYVFEEMLKSYLLIRDAADFPYLNDSFIRFCVLDEESNTKLINKFNYIFK